VEVERLQQEYDIEVKFSPFFLDPSTPPEGKPRRQQTRPGDGPTPIEERAAGLGISFARGRTWTSNSHRALEAAEFVAEEQPELELPFHRAMFKAYFEDLADITQIDTIVQAGAAAGVDEAKLRTSLTEGWYREAVDEEINWAYKAGVQAVPTFVIDGRFAVVGAQDLDVFRSVLQRLGKVPRTESA
jgi:predicted DsbA family dithiol-disulfide isomerase